ncbi:MAG TPA: sulfite exporter TauE/SafE family protein [Chitinispirillaceae bacterium]|nr:sulfite exporter TauE/SafE family protein [Chitinispirillaceae bacterium]
MSFSSLAVYIVIGILAGGLSGIFGIGGGILVVPALVYIAGYSQLAATGTSLAVLLPPIGLAAAMEYYRKGYVNIPAAITIALALMLSSWISAKFTVKLNPTLVKVAFGVFLVVIGMYTILQTVIKK